MFVSGNHLKKTSWYVTLFLHIALVPVFLGIWSTVPYLLSTFSNLLHLWIGLYLMICFRPYQKELILHSYDRALIFSAGLFILEVLVLEQFLPSKYGRVLYQFFSNLRQRILSLSWVKSVSEKGKILSDTSFSYRPSFW